MRAVLALALACGMLGLLASCGSSPDNAGGGSAINIVSRENGSGTRTAFVELFEVQVDGTDGKKVDGTASTAVITNSTAVMLTSVSDDPNAIGYVSLGSLSTAVSALKVDGVDPTAVNVKNGTYKIKRPFNIVTSNTGTSDAAQDFINFIMSTEGQSVVVSKAGCVAVSDNASAYASNGASGKVVVSGSSSVSPAMQHLKEAYASANPDVTVEIQTNDSGTGITSTINGICDIGMASRELKDTEKAAGITEKTIAIDGIAVIVNKSNTVTNLTKEQVKQVFLGEVTNWSAL